MLQKIFFSIFFLFISISFLNAKENINLQLSWKNQFQFAGYYIAKEKGFYSDVNLNVNIKEYISGVNNTDDIVNGKADFAVGRSSLICDRYEGKPITVLAAIFQHSPVMLLTKKRDDITKIKDLKNKNIMLSGDLAASAPINAMLQSKKVTKDMFNIQTHSFDVQDLIEGKTDAMLSYTSNEPYALQKQNIPYTIFSPRDYNFDFYSDILFTSQNLIEKNPQMVKSFREASLKGWKYALEHKNETIELILKKYNTQNRTKDALLFEANEIEKLVDRSTIDIGNIDPKRIEYIAQIYSLMGFVDTNEEISNFIYKVEEPIKSKTAILTTKEKEFIKTHPTIVLGADQNWKPFDWKDKNGNHAGFDADFTRLLEEKLNIDIEVKLGDWTEIQNEVKEKKIDGIIGASKNEQRDKYMFFTEPYFMFSQVVLVRKDNKNISSISDLKGKTIALKKGSLDIAYFNEKYPKIKQKLYNSDEEMILALSAKEVETVLSNVGAASYEIEKNFISNIKVAFNINELSGDMRYGIRNDKPELVSILQKGIELITKDEINTILSKWVKLAVTNENLPKINLSEEEKTWLDKNIPIKFVYDSDWAPFEWKNELGEHTGIIYDLLSLIEENSGIKFQQVPTQNWKEAISFIKEKKADMYSGIGEQADKLSYVNFSKNAIFKTPYVFVSRLEDKNDYLETFQAIENKKVAVVDGYTIHGILKDKKPNIPILTVENIEEGLAKVRDKTLDVFILNAASAKYYINAKGYEDLQIATKTEFVLEIKIALQKDLPKEVMSILNKAIDSISDKERSDIYYKWVEQIIEEVVDYTLIWRILIVVFIIIIVFTFYNRKLKKLVNKKTMELQNLVKSLDEKVNERTGELKEQKEFVQVLLDSQDQIIITTNGKELISANKTFLNFFSIESIKDFLEKYGECICHTFDSNSPNGYLQKEMGSKTWIEYILFHPNQTHKVQIILDNNLFIFSVTASILPNKENLMSAVFTDITQMENSKKEIELILSNILLPVLITSQKERKILYANKYAEKQYDLSLNEIVGSDIDNVYTVQGQHKHIIEAIKKDGFVENSEEVFKTSKGKIFTALLSVTPIMYKNQASYIGMITDITKQKEIENKIKLQEMQMRTLVDAIPSMIFMKDEKGKHLLINKNFTEATGIASDKIIGKTDFDLMQENIAKGITDIDKKVMQSKIPETYEESIPSADGVLKHYLTSKVPLINHDEEVYGIVGIATDITSSKKLQEELKIINKHMKDSIQYASLIQKAIIPDNNLFNKYFVDSFVIWEPKDIVGGDIYLFEELRNADECLLMVIDCTGHGVPGAFVTMLVKAIERQIVAKINNDKNIDVSPAWILKYFNKTMKKLLKQENETSLSNAGFDGGIIYFDKIKKVVKFAGAETPLFYVDKDKKLQTIKGNRHSVGYKKSDEKYEFKDHIINVEESMQFYLTTDGYLDQNGGEEGFPFGKREFTRILNENKTQIFKEQKNILLEEMSAYQKNEERNDDVTVIGFEIPAPKCSIGKKSR